MRRTASDSYTPPLHEPPHSSSASSDRSSSQITFRLLFSPSKTQTRRSAPFRPGEQPIDTKQKLRTPRPLLSTSPVVPTRTTLGGLLAPRKFLASYSMPQSAIARSPVRRELLFQSIPPRRCILLQPFFKSVPARPCSANLCSRHSVILRKFPSSGRHVWSPCLHFLPIPIFLSSALPPFGGRQDMGPPMATLPR
jgi:hypothetical protein